MSFVITLCLSDTVSVKLISNLEAVGRA